MKKNRKQVMLCGFLMLLLGCGIGTAQANDIHWETDADGSFGVGENWVGDEVPEDGDVAVFNLDWQPPDPQNPPVVPGYTVTLDQDRTVGTELNIEESGSRTIRSFST